MTEKIIGQITVIPYLMLPVDQKTGSKLHRCDDPGSNNAAGDPGWEVGTAQPAQRKKASSAKKEHAAVAAAAP